VCVCVYIRTHTVAHKLHVGYWDVTWSPGVGMRHLKSPKDPSGLNLAIYISVFVYTVQMYMYTLSGGMISGLTALFLLANLFFRKRKAKYVYTIPRPRIQLGLSA